MDSKLFYFSGGYIFSEGVENKTRAKGDFILVFRIIYLCWEGEERPCFYRRGERWIETMSFPNVQSRCYISLLAELEACSN